MQVSHEKRSAILEIITNFVIEGHNIIFVTHNAQSARQWYNYFSHTMKKIEIIPKHHKELGLVIYQQRKINYKYPIPIPVPDPHTNPIRWLTHHFKRIFGLLKYEYRNLTMRFVARSEPIECLYGYRGQVYFDNDERAVSNNQFWEILKAMNTDDR